MTKLYPSNRTGAMGALMDLYEQEAELLFEVIREQVADGLWDKIMDTETKDPDCVSVRSICEHMVGAAHGYIEMTKKGENPNYTIVWATASLPSKQDFEPQMRQKLALQAEFFENRWDMPHSEVDAIKIKIPWSKHTSLNADFMMEHAILHIMRHHRQILRFIAQYETVK